MTNREKYLESWSDKKLAKIIRENCSCKTCPVGEDKCRRLPLFNCYNEIEFWLKKEVPSETAR